MTENRRRFVVQEPGDVWIFAYGSLLWDSGFEPAETRPALLRGWHRCFCVSSRIYRGTPETPGLSLGLDRGGSCRGEALRIAERDREAVLAYLEEREMPEEIYSVRPIKLATDGGALAAHTLTVNRDHPLYVSGLGLEASAARIAAGVGKRGANSDYLAQTVAHLDTLGIHDAALHRLLDRVRETASRGI
jgi:cation transport protein ChaC